MNSIASSLAPILILILLGYALKRIHFLSDSSWAGMERLAYFVLFPALLISTLSNQDVSRVPWQEMLIVVVATCVVSAVVLTTWYLARKSVSGDTFTSVFQGGVRFNSYIALGVSQALFGAEGLISGAVTATFMIITVNLLSVAAFSLWGGGRRRGIKPFIRDLLLNPLILACVIGWLLGVTGTGLPGTPGDVIDLIGRAALPVGLLAVGAALQLSSIKGHLRPVMISSMAQFGIKPLCAIYLVGALGITGVPAAVLILTFVTPVAPSSYILSRQLGGDTAVMASIITLQTLLAFVVMPVVALYAL